MKAKVLVSRRVFPEIADQLAGQFSVDHNSSDEILSAEQLRARAHGCAGVLACLTERFDAAFFDACPTVKVISNIAVGYNNIDIAEASRRQVMVTNTPGVLDDTTADLTFALLMAAARRVTETERHLRNGEWKKGFALEQWLGTDVHHASLGIIGMGRIGRTIARRASGFDMTVRYCNRSRLDADTERALNATYCTKQEVLATSDFVVVMVPYSAQTHHLIGAADLALMKPTAIFINTARGGVVDDVALITALKEKHIAGAGIDVFEGEPALNPGFLELDNVALTPHIGSATRATRLRMAALAAENLSDALNGREPKCLVNKAQLKGSAMP
ncbi:MAG TPA: D-glycerate dehydrogenase [Usitatibacteraceae bacterium]|nr:D-glycerate dehydrogenase [Usitatibacteraceae bacterium]